MKEKICRNCGEKNPEDAVMCWMCYSTLSNGSRASTVPPKEFMPPEPSPFAHLRLDLHRPWRPSRKSIAQTPLQKAPETWRDVKICMVCRCRNPLESVTCWNCQASLAELPRDTAKVCPRCRELNPADSRWCFVCYTLVSDVPANGQLVGDIRCPQCYEANPEIALRCRVCGYDLQQPATFFVSAWLLLGIALLAIRGWLPDSYGLAALGLGAVTILAWIGGGRTRFLQQFVLEEIPLPLPEDNVLDEREASDDRPPITNIANTILRYAVRDGATRIAIEKMKRQVRVQYEIKGKWHVQMIVPDYIWVPLREHLVARASAVQTAGRRKGSGRYQGHFDCTSETRSAINIQLDHDWLEEQPHERMTLDLS